MGIRDGAAEGLATRLADVGVPLQIGFALGQVAYVREKRRPAWVPLPAVSPSEVTYLVSEAEKELRFSPPGHGASALVYFLCTRVFGSDAGAALYEAALPTPELTQETTSYGSLIDGALRYFETVDIDFIDDQIMLPAVLSRGSDEEYEEWPGFMLAWKGNFGFFEEKDCFAEDINAGDPVLASLADLSSCAAILPREVQQLQGLERVRFPNVASNDTFRVLLRFQNDSLKLRLGMPFGALDPTMKEQTAQDMYSFLRIMEKALGIAKRSPAERDFS